MIPVQNSREPMMRLLVPLLLLVYVPQAILAQDSAGAVLSRADVEAAIERAKGKEEVVEVRPGRTNVRGTGFVVRLEGPANRIESYARQQLKKYLPVTADSVPQDLLNATLTIVATPLRQVTTYSGGDVVTPHATHAVLAVMVDGAERIVQPTQTEPFDAEVRGMEDNRRNAKLYTVRGIRASFPYAALSAGSFEVRIVTDGREFAYEVDEKRRARLRE